MRNTNGTKLTEKELIKNAMDDVANACCFLYETISPEGNAAAFMVDNALKYLQVVYRGDNVLDAAANYTAYEEEVYIRERKKEAETCKTQQ